MIVADFCLRNDGEEDFLMADEEFASVFEFVGPVVVFNIFELATDDKIVDERLFSCSVIAFVVLPDCELLLFSLNRS